MRFLEDYQRLNALTVRDHHPFKRMDECLDSLGKENVLSAFDASSEYWQISDAENLIDKTGF